MLRPVSHAVLSILALASLNASAVGRGDRDLVAIVNLSLLRDSKLHYRYEEARATMKIERDLGHAYRKIHYLTGHAATHDGFLAALADAENDPAVQAIDVIVYLHGHPGEVGFVDTGFYPMDRLRDEILALSSAGTGGGKLRALYSDACYGETHMADWLRAGFRAVSGSVGTDANWSLDLNRFMNAWRKGKTFGTAIDRANSVWATKLMDRAVHGNSFKRTDGETAFTIDRPVLPDPAAP